MLKKYLHFFIFYGNFVFPLRSLFYICQNLIITILVELVDSNASSC